MENRRISIFISHATPDDNDFAIWLAMRLKACGYSVWCDVFHLTKGGDFWKKIEKQIRECTCRFLPVMTKISNGREGVMQEIAVAKSVGKSLNDKDFIIPLRVDPDLPFSEFDPRLITCNGIDFSASWADGFAELIKNLHNLSCPKESNQDDSALIYEHMLLAKCRIVNREEMFDSNWFLLKNIPLTINFYPLNTDKKIDKIDFPVLYHKNHVVTFVDGNELPSEMRQFLVENIEPIRFCIKEFLLARKDCEFIKYNSLKWLVIGLLAKVFDFSMRKQFRLSIKQVSNRQTAFYYPTGILENDKKDRVLLIGKHKKLKWHFAISGNVKLFPVPMIQFKTHVLFSRNGVDVNIDDRISHVARRSLGKRWWNKEWHSRLMAFVSTLINTADGMILLKHGAPKPIALSSKSIQFKSKVAYEEPASEDGLEDVLNEDLDDELSMMNLEGDVQYADID